MDKTQTSYTTVSLSTRASKSYSEPLGVILSIGVWNYLLQLVIASLYRDDRVMQEKIFGLILPVIEYTKLTEAIARVNVRPKPLALYFPSFVTIFTINSGGSDSYHIEVLI